MKTEPIYLQYFPPSYQQVGIRAEDVELLDETHAIQRFTKNGKLFALNVLHLRSQPEPLSADLPRPWCGGYVCFEKVAMFIVSGHKLVTEKPLTISPSIACPSCSEHGYIKDGKWTNA